MKVIGIDHIGIAVEDLDEGANFWKQIIGLAHLSTEDVDSQGVVTDIYQTGAGKIELLVSKHPRSPIANFIKKRGTGIHHICLQVENIGDAMRFMMDKKIKLIGEQYTIGAEGYKVIFIHPESTGGVLVELAEKNK